jgi:HK97 family phage prohead protease
MQLERREVRLHDVEVKVATKDSEGTFAGYGSVFGNEDSYGDVIKPGAFKQTIKEWKAKGKYPKMLLQHGGMGVMAIDGIPIGKYRHMEEDSKGLFLEGKLFAINTERGQYINEGLQSGELDSLSIGFMTREFIAGTKAGEPRRTLTNIDLWEVSIVTFPANDKAVITDVKALSELKREWEAAFRDGGLSRADALKAVSVLSRLYQRDAEAPYHATPCDEVVSDEEKELLAWLQEKSEAAQHAIILSQLQRRVA